MNENMNGNENPKPEPQRVRRMVKRTLYPRLLPKEYVEAVAAGDWEKAPSFEDLEAWLTQKYPLGEKAAEEEEDSPETALHYAMAEFQRREREMLADPSKLEYSEDSFAQVDVEYGDVKTRRSVCWESSERLDRLIAQLTQEKYMAFSEVQFLFYHVWRFVNRSMWNGYGPSEQGFFATFKGAWEAYVALPSTPVTVEYDVAEKDREDNCEFEEDEEMDEDEV